MIPMRVAGNKLAFIENNKPLSSTTNYWKELVGITLPESGKYDPQVKFYLLLVIRLLSCSRANWSEVEKVSLPSFNSTFKSSGI